MKGWALGLAALALFGAAEVRRFEQAAAREIRAKLEGDKAQVRVTTRPNGLLGYANGDLARVRVKAAHFSTNGLPLFTEPDRSKKGRVRRFELTLNAFYLNGLRVERLKASIPNCRFDLGLAQRKRQIRLSQSGVGTGTVTLLQEDLEAFILRKYSEVKRVSVRLEDEMATVEGYGEFLIVKAEFRVVARLVPLDGTKLALTDARVELDGQAADETAAKVLLEALNPVVDLNRDLRLHGAIEIDKLSLQDGALTASGKTRIPEAPATTPMSATFVKIAARDEVLRELGC